MPFSQKKWNWSAQKSGLPPEARPSAHSLFRRSRISRLRNPRLNWDWEPTQSCESQSTIISACSPDALRERFGHAYRCRDCFRWRLSRPPAPLISARSILCRELAALAHVRMAHGFTSMPPMEALSFFRPASRKARRNRNRRLRLASTSTNSSGSRFRAALSFSATRANFDFIKMHADYLNPELHEDAGIPNLVTTSLLTSSPLRRPEIMDLVSNSRPDQARGA